VAAASPPSAATRGSGAVLTPPARAERRVGARRAPDREDLPRNPVQIPGIGATTCIAAPAHAGEIDTEIDTQATTQVCMDLLWGLAMDIGCYSDEQRTQPTMRAVDRIVAATLAPTRP
jgi:hypothetical protein